MMFVNSGCKCIGHQTVRIKRTTQFRSLTASICTYRLVGEQKLVRIRSEQTLSYRKRNEKKSATTLRSILAAIVVIASAILGNNQGNCPQTFPSIPDRSKPDRTHLNRQ